MAPKLREALSIEVAMNNLEAIAAIDLNAPGPIGILQKNRLVTDSEEFPSEPIQWVSAEGAEVLLDILDGTFRALRDYMAELLENPESDVQSEKGVTGIASLMALAGSTAHTMDNYLESRMGHKTGKVSERPEFRVMHDFFKTHFDSKVLETEPHVPDEMAVKDMDMVRLDKEYELFYIRHEDGMPFYNLEMVRNMRLICDFESEEGEFEEDPLLKVRAMIDRDAGASSGQILASCDLQIGDFYKVSRKLAKNDFAAGLSKACMALFLSFNPRNLLQNTQGKTSLQYFEDFHRFLRESFRSTEYQKLVAYPPEKSDKLAHIMLSLAHALSKSFFRRVGGVKEEAIGLIHRAARKGGSLQKKQTDSIWENFLFEDEIYRSLLSKFPSGPLLKILDLIRSDEEESIPFDSILQGNYPLKVFETKWDGAHVEFIRLGSPTTQSVINKAEIVDEFRGLLRNSSAAEPLEKHLLFNLQDKTSWKEMARCNALDGLQKNAEFNKVLNVVNLSKDSNFYYQIKQYANKNEASEFISTLTSQFQTVDENLISFREQVASVIHKNFFGANKTLNRREREDFIEIFYQFLVLKIIDLYEPSTVSFTCKDGIDTGAAETAGFYAFLKLLKSEFATKEVHDYFRWLLYAPALFVRERSVDQERLNRMLSALETFDRGMEKNGKGVTKEMEKLYKPNLVQTLKV